MEAPDPRYEIVLYWSNEDSAYVAEVPELPGCVSHGESYTGAVESVEDAIRAWIETARELGRTVPEPKGRRLQFA
ncbi:MAG: type II toxin-antitoxin system HicB family antitoxin [Bacteroidota bacterium]